AMRMTADGTFASDHWKTGDYIRERFPLAIPAAWHGDGIAIGLVTADPAGTKQPVTGAALVADPFTAVLGVLALDPGPPTEPARAGRGKLRRPPAVVRSRHAAAVRPCQRVYGPDPHRGGRVGSHLPAGDRARHRQQGPEQAGPGQGEDPDPVRAGHHLLVSDRH